MSVTDRSASTSDPNLPRTAVAVHAGAREGIIAGKSGGMHGSSRAMLATARPSCYILVIAIAATGASHIIKRPVVIGLHRSSCVVVFSVISLFVGNRACFAKKRLNIRTHAGTHIHNQLDKAEPR